MDSATIADEDIRCTAHIAAKNDHNKQLFVIGKYSVFKSISTLVFD